ncbi:MAG: hypothetical protein JWL82_59 [Parcubacteria group bacterium]|nr:hypothetical protein [Parcubacteria group bacterium]
MLKQTCKALLGLALAVVAIASTSSFAQAATAPCVKPIMLNGKIDSCAIYGTVQSASPWQPAPTTQHRNTVMVADTTLIDGPAGQTTATFAPRGNESAVQPQSTGPVVGRNLRDSVIVDGDLEEVNRRRLAPNPAIAFAKDRQTTELTREEWTKKGWSMETFDAVERDNRHFCSSTSTYIAHAASLMRRYGGKAPEIVAIRDRYIGMEKTIKNAYATATGANVFTGAMGFLSSPLYGAMTAGAAIGSQAQTRAWEKMMFITKDAGVLTQDLNGLHVEFNIMSLEMYADYLGLVEGYCTGRYSNSQ